MSPISCFDCIKAALYWFRTSASFRFFTRQGESKKRATSKGPYMCRQWSTKRYYEKMGPLLFIYTVGHTHPNNFLNCPLPVRDFLTTLSVDSLTSCRMPPHLGEWLDNKLSGAGFKLREQPVFCIFNGSLVAVIFLMHHQKQPVVLQTNRSFFTLPFFHLKNSKCMLQKTLKIIHALIPASNAQTVPVTNFLHSPTVWDLFLFLSYSSFIFCISYLKVRQFSNQP